MTGTLKKINGKDIAKIASGQVIVDLKSVIKELIENALDAKATNIDIRITNYGADWIEVSDNGSGIRKEDFGGIAMKYYTSKIACFDDIHSVHSYGFRGEALSCICELSGEFTVITRHESVDIGSFIKYNPNGSIAEERDQARTVGTTISIKNLFERLPVRRKAYIKSNKTHLSNMITLVQSYAVSSLGVRISLSHHITSSGKTITLLSVPANYSIKQRIQTIFGSQVSSSLSEFNASFMVPRQVSQNNSLLSETTQSTSVDSSVLSDTTPAVKYRFESKCNWHYTLEEEDCDVHGYVTGFVSRIGSSTNSSDRGNVNLSSKGNQSKQLLFVNNRFVEYKKLIDAFVQVWRDYEPRTMPVLVLNIILPSSYYDINLSIDKKQILFMKEEVLFRALQEIFHCALDTSNMNMKVTSVSNDVKKIDSLFSDLPSSLSPTKSSLSLDDLPLQQNLSEESVVVDSKPGVCEVIAFSPPVATDSIPVVVDRCKKSKKRRDPINELHSKRADVDMSRKECVEVSRGASSSNPLGVSKRVSRKGSSEELQSGHSNQFVKESEEYQSNRSVKESEEYQVNSSEKQPTPSVKDPEKQPTPSVKDPEKQPTPSIKDPEKQPTPSEKHQSTQPNTLQSTLLHSHKLTSSISLESILSQFTSLSNQSSYSLSHTDFVDSPHQEDIETELTRVLKKDHFTEMEVIGQFNNSFIICRHRNELYIFDQHACNEKYNYETMMNENKIQSQKLIKPISLELSPDQEFVVIHHMNVFSNSGFEMGICEEKPIGSRLQLVSLPASKQYTFTVSDFMELLAVVMESGGNVKRTPKLAKILATRACHKSVRAGDPLPYSKMVSIVRSLATLDRPWSCPHGRPTLRHLVTLVHS